MHKNTFENVVFTLTIALRYFFEDASENKKFTPLKIKNIVVKDPRKLSTKTFLRSSQEWIDSGFKLSSHVRGAGSRTIGK